ncbi:hypothetical protein MSAN_00945700 [Mycena sanguinolenta]|uniref:Uncharacterized protein n=1 Tax=Mycena sanguinolenta TaxID=230812 RepID=A0A8H6YTG7_9AGAR|nr:hypothetical protein MSAN_00945700 [Mycena sanguinolenta]
MYTGRLDAALGDPRPRPAPFFACMMCFAGSSPHSSRFSSSRASGVGTILTTLRPPPSPPRRPLLRVRRRGRDAVEPRRVRELWQVMVALSVDDPTLWMRSIWRGRWFGWDEAACGIGVFYVRAFFRTAVDVLPRGRCVTDPERRRRARRRLGARPSQNTYAI